MLFDEGLSAFTHERQRQKSYKIDQVHKKKYAFRMIEDTSANILQGMCPVKH